MNMNSAHRLTLIAAALAILLLVHAPSAQGFGIEYCSSVIPTQNGLSNLGSLSTILGFSLVIMLTMAAIAGLAFGIGYAFRMGGLQQAGKQELGEIVITTLIVLVLLGTFTIGNALSPPQLLTNGGAYNPVTFIDDCTNLANYGFTLLQYLFDLVATQDFLNLLSSFTVNLMPLSFGVSFTPFGGYGLVAASTNLLFLASGGMGALLLSISAVLGIFYAIMPLFLFAGIILRTLPVTRPAGGAFLGIFIAFYFVFPILLHFMIANTPVTLTPSQLGQAPTTGYFASFLNLLENPGATFTFFNSITILFDPSYTLGLITAVLIPAMYGVFSAIFSFMISFDFAELMGDFLGSPSLRSGDALKRLL